MIGVCDANYCFTLVDIESYDSTNDASVLLGLLLGKAFENFQTNFNIPAISQINERELQYILLGYDIFPLKLRLMKPIPRKNLSECQKVYNYCFSRARRVIQNAFGMLLAKCIMFRKPIREQILI